MSNLAVCESKREELFIKAMDDVQEYLNASKSLHQSLRNGFINLAEFRCKMPSPFPLPVVPLKMKATKRIKSSTDDGVGRMMLIDVSPLGTSSKAVASVENEQIHDNTADEPEFSSSLLQELASKYEDQSPSHQQPSTGAAAGSKRSKPLFDQALILPTKTEFTTAIERIIELANAQQKALQSIQEYTDIIITNSSTSSAD